MKFKSLVSGLLFSVSVLLVSGAEANAQRPVPTYSNLHKDSNLRKAVVDGRSAVARLLKKGTVVTATDQQKNTLLHYAAAEDKPGLIRFLLSKGAPIEAAGYMERTPLYYAVAADTYGICRLLVCPPGTSTYEPGPSSTLKTLLKRGANVAAQEIRGWTPLYRAVREGDEAVVRLLLEYAVKNDMDIDVQEDGFGYTALHGAVLYDGNSKTIVKLLLEAGADTDVAEDVVGWTPLHLAARWHPEYVRLFIKHDADVNATTDSGGTPLDMAVGAGNNRAAKLLRNAGAKHSPGFKPNPEG